ncbi:phosphodiesterase [Microvirga rosea]|uniref:phosphodiesterase n=1 Tax=Microvirga rosea TaxID=2715425 RepID=UPI001D0AFFCB|nr:phosphodiesterase [Microvirga rosea]MCB8822818.1 phosphodiesterase [Microvirga rosea]
MDQNSVPTVIAQISDLHIKPGGAAAYGVVDTAAYLRSCVAFLNEYPIRPDAIVISGDLVDVGSDEEYAFLRNILKPLQIPFYVIPGNHDERDSLRRSFPDHSYLSAHGPLNALVRVRDVDLILLDSSVPGKPHGFLEKESLEFLDTSLASQRGRPALVFLHHPPFLTGIRHMDCQNLLNADELAIILRQHQRTKIIAAGHVHRTALTLFAGIPATICPSPAHAVALDITPEGPSAFKIEPPGMHLHIWTPASKSSPVHSGELVTHLVPIGDFPGPYPFFDENGNLL